MAVFAGSDPTTYFTDGLRRVLKEKASCTWDVAELNQFDRHYVFTYGTLMTNGSNNKLIGNVGRNKFIGAAVTDYDKFDMAIAVTKEPQHRFPVALINSGDTERYHRIKGELFLVTTETLLKMDKLEQNYYMYYRNKENILIGNNKVEAWMYIGMDGFWKTKHLIDMIPLVHNKIKYHQFNSTIAQNIVVMGDRKAA